MEDNKSEYDKINAEIIESIVPDSFKDRAFGCIVGAFIGDAAGSGVQFSKTVLNDEKLDECMEMNGGGPYNLGPG